ncbi:MAG: methyl-viologen-reducing hydrogenase subunit delta [Clostridiaceae bacterium BRH_c20a]|nr:MAG: methyl-viologen-reducing hydrogenase subunit delta [Clostridiaceae bacterium BRH_c20a]
MNDKFEPKILGILCNWCSYAGADLAGTSRLRYPANIRIVKVMCSGRVEPTLILKAFQEGADGVLISGCHPGDCHYVDGNIKTLRRTPLVARLLTQIGIEPERFKQVWVSASEGERFGKIVEQMVEDIKKVGPYQKKMGDQLDVVMDEVAASAKEAAAAAEEKGGLNCGS